MIDAKPAGAPLPLLLLLAAPEPPIVIDVKSEKRPTGGAGPVLFTVKRGLFIAIARCANAYCDIAAAPGPGTFEVNPPHASR